MESLKRLFAYAGPLRRYWPGFLTLSFLSLIFGIANYALLGPFLSVLFESDTIQETARPEAAFTVDFVKEYFSYLLSGIVHKAGPLRGLLFVSGFLILACLCANICRYLSQRILVTMKTTVMKGLRKDLFAKISALHIGYFNNERKGNILSTLSNDVNEIQNTVANSLHIMLRDPVLIIGFLVMLFYMSPRLTLVSLIALPVTGLAVTAITRRMRADSIEMQGLMGQILSQFEETISGSRIIRAFNAGKYVGDRFEKTNEKHRAVSRQVYNRQEMASPTSEFLGITIAAVVLIYGGWLNIQGKLGMSWSGFIVYIMFYWKVLEPAKNLANCYASVRKGLVSCERVFAILDIPEKILEAEHPVEKKSFDGSIELREVTFAYTEEPVLRNVSFSIPKGKMIAVVGHSGAGKSTIADLLPRFWDIDGGSILLDGTDIREYRISDLIDLMGIVPQEPILFNDTVAANISFGMEGVTREEIVAAAKVANADEFISTMEGGYDANIGDRGAKLSGGQRQRIAIARAVLKNPPIMILDEATSALDAESERLVQAALARLMENRTSLVIAHRLSTIRHADEIIVLQEGRVAERGTHEQLIAKEGIYSHLCKLQDFS